MPGSVRLPDSVMEEITVDLLPSEMPMYITILSETYTYSDLSGWTSYSSNGEPTPCVESFDGGIRAHYSLAGSGIEKNFELDPDCDYEHCLTFGDITGDWTFWLYDGAEVIK